MTENKLGTEKVSKLVFSIAIPSMLAQFINVLYSIVDRIFVGNIPLVGDDSLAGVGICCPIITLLTAFASLVGIGGAPLLGIAMGEKNNKKAEKILGNSFMMLIGVSVVVTIISLIFKEPLLKLFGASDKLYPYANKYFTVCVGGIIFALLSIGMYQFVVAQGYAKIGMFSVILGAVMNIILDPIFIFVFKLNVTGAALATIISQFCSALFTIIFLFTKSEIRIKFGNYSAKLMLNVAKLGLTPFVIIALDNVMLIAVNSLLQKYGKEQGDFLITVNTIVQSFMLVITMPLGGISGGTKCILSYNYGAGNSKRILDAQKYIIALCVGYTTIMFIFAMFGSKLFVSLFTKDPETMKEACRAIHICTYAKIILLGVQYAIVDGFTGLKQVKIALTLSLWRKLLYFTAVFILPAVSSVFNIFYAETISDVGCLLLSIPLYLVSIKKILKKREEYVRLNHIGENEKTSIKNRSFFLFYMIVFS